MGRRTRTKPKTKPKPRPEANSDNSFIESSWVTARQARAYKGDIAEWFIANVGSEVKEDLRALMEQQKADEEDPEAVKEDTVEDTSGSVGVETAAGDDMLL
ncbi:unnamed protein product [Zymoseptoria tritici ST99CH_3D1]|nr:unnamed protein product [Zymoseptoria tritici ST99CH_3D1]